MGVRFVTHTLDRQRTLDVDDVFAPEEEELEDREIFGGERASKSDRQARRIESRCDPPYPAARAAGACAGRKVRPSKRPEFRHSSMYLKYATGPSG